MSAPGLVSMPMGTNVLIGASAAPPPLPHLEQLRDALASVTGLAEAHLPMVFAKELASTPQLVLALFPMAAADADHILNTVAEVTKKDPWSSRLAVTFISQPALASTIQAAAVQVYPHVSPEWSTRKQGRLSSTRLALAVIVSLVILAVWQLLNQ